MLSKLETKIPPPVYGIATAALIWWLAKAAPSLTLIPSSISKLGIALIIVGVLIDVYALVQFIKQRTTPNPLSPQNANDIVISGLYKFSRNPMYLGLLLSLTGWAIYQANLIGFVCLPIFIWLINTLQITPEERILLEKFGDSYQQYLTKVRRWI